MTISPKLFTLLIISVMNTPSNANLFTILRRIILNIVKGVGTKYFLVLGMALAWMIFFDRYSIPAQINMSRQIQEEKQHEQWYSRAMEGLDAQRVRLETNEEELERLAREKFL